jgi:biotin transport system permease protein
LNRAGKHVLGSLYSEHQTWLHRVPAAIKLFFFAVLGPLLFLLDGPIALAVSVMGCGILFASLGQATRSARKLVISVIVAGLLIMAFHTWMQQAVLGMVSALRLLSASLLGIALTLTTRSRDLLSVFEHLLSPLQRLGIRTERLALQLALMLRFTEHFFVVWKRLDDAHRVRTGKAGGFKILAPLTIKMLISARHVADALELRLGE